MMAEFLSMGGYGWYVWMSYGACALAVAAEILAVRARTRRALAQARDAEVEPAPGRLEAAR
jgi:heme exporter protein D